MKPTKLLILALTMLGSSFLLGCASSYHAYPCGRVPYCYCPPSPLPHSDYHACPTCLASKYLARPQDTSALAAETDSRTE